MPNAAGVANRQGRFQLDVQRRVVSRQQQRWLQWPPGSEPLFARAARQVHQPQQEFGGTLPHLLKRLAHGGERRVLMPGGRRIVKAHDGDVFRDTQPVFFGILQHAPGHMIVGGENGRRPLRLREQLAGAGTPAGNLEIPLHHPIRIDRQPGFLQRLPVARKALLGALVVRRPLDVRNAPMAQAKQMAHSAQRAQAVIHAHTGNL